MSHIFISYSHAEPDRSYTLKLVDELRRRGFAVWYDEQIPNSSRWAQIIEGKTRECAAFIVIMTPRSKESEWVENECDLARELKKPRFPIVLEGEVWFGFRHLQAHIVSNSSLPSQKFFDDLATAVGSLPSQPAQKSWIGPAGSRIWIPDWVGTIIPPPFAWVEIPKGQVTLEGGGYVPDQGLSVPVPSFAIAKYPTTVAQFQEFVEARDGYRDSSWWEFSDSARQWRKTNAHPQDVEKFSRDDHPRINVTWFESVAFCRWLAAKTKSPAIRLPAEAGWQRAAEGDDHLVYPYGNKFDKSRCNFASQGTTPVTQYEGAQGGDSPFGVTDLSGNVWEWCASAWENHTDQIGTDVQYRVLRGGSWADNFGVKLRSTACSWNGPHCRSSGWGFRCALS